MTAIPTTTITTTTNHTDNSATAATTVSPKQAADAANRWLGEHYDELASRARASAPRKPPAAREEIVAEMLAIIVLAVHRAAQRDRLEHLTPFWLATFARRHVAEGRVAAGYSSRCAMSDATRMKRGVRVLSLDRDFDVDDPDSRRLSDVLADRRAEDPAEIVRRDHDYAKVFASEAVSAKARRTFDFLAETHGAGKQADLAVELRVSPGRVCQLKREVADALSRHGYHGPLTRRPVNH